MRLQHAFYRFPFRFDVQRLQTEVATIPEEIWRQHVQSFKGNAHLPLISTQGGMNDSFEPPMAPTEFLKRLPYIQQVFAQFKTLHGRARLMRLEPGHGVPRHFDMQYYWRTHTRVHIPIITNPDIRFHVGDESVHMAEGEAWTFDNWRMHKVINETPTRRIHLTFDTFGSEAFWDMARPYKIAGAETLVPFDANARPALRYETFVGDSIMSPADVEIELRNFVGDVAADPANDLETVASIQKLATAMGREWRMLWYSVGPTSEGLPAFDALRKRMTERFKAVVSTEMKVASNGWQAWEVLLSTFVAMVKPIRRDATPRQGGAAAAIGPRFDRPVFIVSAPRSGSTLLFEALAKNEALWTLGGEGHGHVERVRALAPQARDFESNRLTAADATKDIRAELRTNFIAGLRNAADVTYTSLTGGPEKIRFLEKTPKNALRIPFFKAMFPDAKFIFLHREPRANISSIMDAWRSGRFVTYPNLKDWAGMPWSMLLIPGWRSLAGANLARVAMRQWRDTNEIILDDLAAMPAEDWTVVRYEDFLDDPGDTLKRLCRFADIPFGESMRKVAAAPLEPSRYTLSTPDPEKWRRNEPAMSPFLGETSTTAEKLAGTGARDAKVPEAAQ